MPAPRLRLALLLLLVAVAPAATPAAPLATSPRLSLSAERAAPGEALTAAGARFPRRAASALVWADDGRVLGEFRTTADGSFKVRFAVPDVTVGRYGVRATVGTATAARGRPGQRLSAAEAADAALTFAPEADALVEAARPGANVGAAALVVDREPQTETYLRFAVGGVGGAVTRATLRLYAFDASTNGPAVYPAGNGWDERTIDWNTKPAPASSTPADDKGAIPADAWVEFDVTSLVAGNGTYTFALVPPSRDGADFRAREYGDPALRPQVVLTVDDGAPSPGPTATPTSTPTATPSPTPTATATAASPPGTPGPVTAAGETQPVPHGGDAADDPAIWLHPTDPSKSAVIGTDKLGGLAVYDLAGDQIAYYPDSTPNNVDLRYNFPLGGERVALVVTSDSKTDTLRPYRVDPETRDLTYVASRSLETGLGVAGLCLYASPVSGKYYAFVGDSSGTVQQWELFDDGAGKVAARKVRTLSLNSVTEGCVADDVTGNLFIAQEDVAIWRYGAEPEAGQTRTRVDVVGEGGHLTADIEGLALSYGSDGDGYLLASSQGSDTFVVYERGGGHAYVTTFAVTAGTAVDGVSHTDGIEVTNAALGPAFPGGVFVAQDDDNRDGGGNQNFKLVPWERIARSATPALAIDTAWDPRRVGG